jgi:hypothetical protein
MGRACSTYRREEEYMGKQEGNRPLERLRRRWRNNTKIYVREIGWGGLRIETSGGHLWTR